MSVNDLEASIATLRRLAEKLNAECVELRRRHEHHGCIADLLIRERADERDFIEVRLTGHNNTLFIVYYPHMPIDMWGYIILFVCFFVRRNLVTDISGMG